MSKLYGFIHDSKWDFIIDMFMKLITNHTPSILHKNNINLINFDKLGRKIDEKLIILDIKYVIFDTFFNW